MKKLCLIAIGFCALSLVMPTSVFAAKADGKKAKIIAKYDKNSNGAIDGDEREALRKDYAANKDGELKRFDTNGDGKLDDAEIAAIKPGSGNAKAAGTAGTGKKGGGKAAKTDDSKTAKTNDVAKVVKADDSKTAKTNDVAKVAKTNDSKTATTNAIPKIVKTDDSKAAKPADSKAK